LCADVKTTNYFQSESGLVLVVTDQGCHVRLVQAEFQKSGLVSSWLPQKNFIWPFSGLVSSSLVLKNSLGLLAFLGGKVSSVEKYLLFRYFSNTSAKIL